MAQGQPGRQAAHQVQRRLRSPLPDALPVPIAQRELFHPHAVFGGRADPHQPHRLFGGAAVRPGNAGEGHGHIGLAVLQRAQSHLGRHLGADGPLGLQHLMADAQQLLFCLVGIGDETEPEHPAAAGHPGDALGHQAAGATLGRGGGPALLGQQPHHRVLQPGHVLIVYRIAVQRVEVLGVLMAHHLGGLHILGAGRNADVTLAGFGIDGGGGVLVGKQLAAHGLQRALAADDVQGDAVQGAAGALGQQGAHALLPHGLQLMGRAGHQHRAAAALILKPHARGRAVVVGDLSALHRHHGLLAVVLGHFAAGAAVKVLDLLHLFCVKAQGVAIAGGHGLLGQVIGGGAKPAAKHQQVTAALGLLHQLGQAARIVSDHVLMQHGDAQVGQLPAQVLGIGIQNVAEQKLSAHGNNLSSHGVLSSLAGPLTAAPPAHSGAQQCAPPRRRLSLPVLPGRAWRPPPPESPPPRVWSWDGAG